MRDLEIGAVGAFSFSDLSARQEQAAEAEFRNAANRVHEQLVSCTGFTPLLQSLRKSVATHVKDIEKARKSEHAAYVEEERQRQAAEADGIRQAELARKQREEGERRRKAEEEWQNTRRLQREAAERRQRELAEAEPQAKEQRRRRIRQ
jgi:hypothetical protein